MAKRDKIRKQDNELTGLAKEIDEASKAADLQDPDIGETRFDKVINRLIEVAGVSVLTTIVLIIFLNALGRYILNTTMIWGDEVVLGLLPWLGMLGMFLSIRRRQIIKIEFFALLMPAVVRRVLEISTTMLAAMSFIYLAVVSFEYLQLFGGDKTIYLQISKGWFMSAMLIGPILACLAYLVMLVQDILSSRRKSS